MIGVVGAARSIYGDKVVIHTQTIALCITIGEESSLQHLIGREADAVYYVYRIERRLLHLGKEVLGVAIKFQNSNDV